MAIGESAGILLRLRADGSQAKRELSELQKDVKGTGSAFSGLAGPAAIAAIGVTAIATAAVASATALFNLSKQTADFGSEIFDATQKTGLGAETMSALKIAAEQAGSSFEGITNAVSKFNVLLGNAANGNEKAEAILKQYGVTATDTQGALEQAITAIAGMTNASQQAAAAGALFKDRTGEILPVIKSFDGNLPGLINKLRDLGVLMSDKDAAAADIFGDQLDQLNLQLASVGRTIGFAVMPAFNKMAADMSGWLAKNKSEVSTWGTAFGVAMDNAYRNISSIVQFVKDNETWFRVLLGTAGNLAIDHFAEQVRRRKAQEAKDQEGALDFSTLTEAERKALSPLRSQAEIVSTADEPGKVHTQNIGRADNDPTRDRIAYEKKLAEESLDNERQTMAERIAIRAAEYKALLSLAARYAADQGKTEADLEKYQEDLATQLLEFKQDLLKEYIAVLKQAGPEGVEPLRKAEHDLQILEKDIEAQRDTFAKNERDRNKKATDDEIKLREEKFKSRKQYVEQLAERQKREDEEEERKSRKRILETTVGSGSEISAIGQLQDYFAGEGNTLALAGIEALSGAFEGLARAVGATVQAWVLYGKAGQSVRQVTAQMLASIASQAAIKAIFELAEGFAALAMSFFGVPNAGPSATAHFAAAAIYGSIAGVAAIAGRAVAGDSFKKQTAAAGGQSSSTSGNRSTGNQGEAYSSQPNGIIDQGRNQPAFAGNVTLTLKLDSNGVLNVVRDSITSNGIMRGLIIDTAGA